MKPYLSNQFDFNNFVDVYDEVPLWSAPFGLKLLEMIDYRKNITALDIGFGNGFPLTEIALRLGNSSKVYGIDPWKEAIERARRKIKYYQISNVTIFEGVAENIPLGDGSVDLITSNNGINNVEDIEKVFAECSRVAKPGAQFIQTMNLDKSMFEFYTVFERTLLKLGLKNEVKMMKEHIYQKRKPLEEIVDITNRNGFVIKNLEHSQFDYRFSDGSTLLNHYFIRIAFMDSWLKIMPKDKTEQIFDLIETELNEQANLAGGIKLSIPFVTIDALKK